MSGFEPDLHTDRSAEIVAAINARTKAERGRNALAQLTRESQTACDNPLAALHKEIHVFRDGKLVRGLVTEISGEFFEVVLHDLDAAGNFIIMDNLTCADIFVSHKKTNGGRRKRKTRSKRQRGRKPRRSHKTRRSRK